MNWSPLIRALHWLSVPLMVVCLAAVWGHEAFSKADPLRGWLMSMHFTAGLLLGLFAVLRIVTRLSTPSPTHPMPAWMRKASTAGQYLMYGLLLALPLFGYLAVSGKGQAIAFIGGLTLTPVTISSETAHFLKEAHELAGNLLIGVVALHVLAAVAHAKLMGDKVVASMLGTVKR